MITYTDGYIHGPLTTNAYDQLVDIVVYSDEYLQGP
jgi:hypothetical protein